MTPARSRWWDEVVSADSVRLNDFTYLLWGDRVQVLEEDEATDRVHVHARGTTGWIDRSDLGGEPLLEVYVIDVGQGDGILVVTPEGHHLMVDGGYQRSRQPTGKSAADFVDWKFHRDYLLEGDRDDADLNMIRLDGMVASHADADHYGGLRDLVDRETDDWKEELDSVGVTVERFYHPGLCPQESGSEELGRKVDGHLVDLLGNRASVVDAVAEDPSGDIEARGWWADFLTALLEQETADGAPTPIERLSRATGFLPGFGPGDGTDVEIRVLAPVTTEVDGGPALEDVGDEGENKNGHSVALRLDYGERRVLLTGDLNEKSQEGILEVYGDAFASEWRADVAKACHHGSHHVDLRFLRGVSALSTIFSSGDANTFDHPRAWVLGAAALTGRVVEHPSKHILKAPLVYSTEVARSVTLDEIEQLREYEDPQIYGRPTEDPVLTVSGEVTRSRWRAVFDRDSNWGGDQPPLPAVKAAKGIIYGLVNVRTDGRRVLFAVRNEGNHSWAYEVLEPEDFEEAYRLVPESD